MGLDRRIRIRRYDEEISGFGEPTATLVEDTTVWASTRDSGSFDVNAPEGFYIQQQKTFTLRFNVSWLLLQPDRFRIDDEYGREFNIEQIDEIEGAGIRRRFMLFVGVATGRVNVSGGGFADSFNGGFR